MTVLTTPTHTVVPSNASNDAVDIVLCLFENSLSGERNFGLFGDGTAIGALLGGFNLDASFPPAFFPFPFDCPGGVQISYGFFDDVDTAGALGFGLKKSKNPVLRGFSAEKGGATGVVVDEAAAAEEGNKWFSIGGLFNDEGVSKLSVSGNVDEIDSGGGGLKTGLTGAGVDGCPEIGTRFAAGTAVMFTSDIFPLSGGVIRPVPGREDCCGGGGGEGLRGGVTLRGGVGFWEVCGGVGRGVASKLARPLGVLVVHAPGTALDPNVACRGGDSLFCAVAGVIPTPLFVPLLYDSKATFRVVAATLAEDEGYLVFVVQAPGVAAIACVFAFVVGFCKYGRPLFGAA